MTTTSNPVSIWAHKDRFLIGKGPIEEFDPGTGPGRYSRALAALRESDAQLAMASFTFDLDEPGSVVAIPASVIDAEAGDLRQTDTPLSGTISSDGERQWRHGIAGALEAIDADVLEKVVLTRQVDVTLDAQPDVETLVARLIESQPDSFTFAVGGLVGASPELLASLRHGQVSSLVLAGTAAESAELSSDKMSREHALSRSSVEDGLAPHVHSLTIDQRTVLEFGRIKHLATRFEGYSTDDATVLDLVASLHPTAAVAGTPTDVAVKTIKDLEPRPRGRYAGPVGWFDRDGEGEFAIALRCGLIGESSAVLYAGGGIVRGSEVDAEYAETELKLAPMLGALGIG